MTDRWHDAVPHPVSAGGIRRAAPERPKMIVVDNSVICGFVISSDACHAGAAACRDRDPDWHAPFLSRTEFRSVAAGYRRKGEPPATLMAAGALSALSVQAHHLTDAEVFRACPKTCVLGPLSKTLSRPLSKSAHSSTKSATKVATKARNRGFWDKPYLVMVRCA
jgi:hypothetical protein